MPRSPSASPPLSPPPPVSRSRPSSSKKPAPASEVSDDIEAIDVPRQSKAGQNGDASEADAGAEGGEERKEKQQAEAKKRYQADLALHAYEAPKADRPQDDWQVAYVWAFIVKFNLKDRIKRLECLEDFEQSLMEPVANRPDDILEGILIRFLGNLKPGLRNLDPTNIQHHLSNHISDQLLGPSEFTVWDRPWAPNEEARASCCTQASDRTELGRLRYAGEPPAERVSRNPLVKAAERGGGLFELHWRERAGLLRQLVDWQLTHSEHIRAIINKENHAPLPKGVTVPESQAKVGIEPIGMDRNKQRIWVFDNSGRIYKSGNPFKRPCPIFAISSNKTEMQAQIDLWAAHGNSPKPEVGPKGKKAEVVAAKKAAKGIEDEKKLAEVVGGLMEAVEKEDARIARARKKIADQAKIFEQAEFRSTRTRRTTRKIDYSYDGDEGEDEEEYEQPRRTSRRGETSAAAAPSKPLIPGERTSARLRRNNNDEAASVSHTGDGGSSPPIESRQTSPVEAGDEEEARGAKRQKMENGSEGRDDEADGNRAGMNGHGKEGRNGNANEDVDQRSEGMEGIEA